MAKKVSGYIKLQIPAGKATPCLLYTSLQKEQILKSWQRLTRYHEELVHGNTELVRDVQAGLWRIKKEWIR